MAKLTHAPGQPAVSGRLGNVVYRRRNGQSEVVRRPKAPAVGWSAAQEANREKFAIAAAYARDVLANPLHAQCYGELASATKRSVMSILIGDYRTPPTVDLIDDTGYRARAGDPIHILASDDLEVIAVQVTLRDLKLAVIEEGPAVKVHGIWNYTAKTTLSPTDPVIIDVVALDRPRHEGQGRKIWMPGATP